MNRKLTLIVAVAATTMAVACTAKFVRDTHNKPFTYTPEKVERGRYLVDNVAYCGVCHSGREDGTLMSPEDTTQYLAGGLIIEEPGMRFFVPNITPDKETGIGDWTDDELSRAIRDGITRDGRLMFPAMPYYSYKHMSDEDVEAIVAYLRVVPPIKQTKERFDWEAGFMAKFFIGKVGVMAHEPASNVEGPAADDPVARGRYITYLGHCDMCHNGKKMGVRDEDDNFYGGNKDAPSEIPEIGKVWMRNLTPHKEHGLGKYSSEQIKEALRTGMRLDGKKMAPPMSMFIPHISGLTDSDLDAVVAFLQSLPPSDYQIPERELTAEGKRLFGEDGDS